MKRFLLALFVLAAMRLDLRGQESQIQSDFRREVQDFQTDCAAGGFKGIFGCAKEAFTEQPVHIAVGTIAPQDGFGVGPSFVESRNTANWRLSLNSDAVVSTNASWRAGAYLKAIFTKQEPITIVTDPKKASAVNLVHEYPVLNFYVQGISLNAVDYYGIGPATQRSSEAIYGMRETIAGFSGLYPLFPRFRVSLFGEFNGRFVDIRDGGSPAMALSHVYTNATAPGLANQPGFLQAGEGVRMQPPMFGNRVQPDLSLTYQQFVAPGSQYSFQRLNTNVGVTVPLYHSMIATTRSYNGPDECGVGVHARTCPVVMDRTGSVGLRLLITQSMTPAGNAVPFYFQPTIGGGDINNDKLLPAYADYRFRAPNLLVVQANFEHSIYGPLGFQFIYDIGKVAATRSDVDFDHLAHSFGAGLTLRAGGIPQISFLFAFGGGEGTHTLLLVNNSLLGGSARPSLF
jgi:hypothetical protein